MQMATGVETWRCQNGNADVLLRAEHLFTKAARGNFTALY